MPAILRHNAGMTPDEAQAALEAGQDSRELIAEMVAGGGWTETGAAEFLTFVQFGGDVDPDLSTPASAKSSSSA